MAADTGFLPRFLIAEPPSAIGFRFASQVTNDRDAIERFGHRLAEIMGMPLPISPETGALEPRPLWLAPEAKALLVRFSDAIELEQGPGKDLRPITGYASKIAEQAARIAGVLTLWGDLHAQRVELAAMANGIRLAQHYLTEALRLSNAAAITVETERAEALRRWLIEVWPDREILFGDMLQKGPNGLRDQRLLKPAVAALVSNGWLVPLEKGAIVRGAARKEAYVVVRAGDVV
jgi:hypothetical protein